MVDVFTYKGNTVQIASTADMPREYKPRGQRGWVVQAALNEVEPWNQGEDPIETIDDLNARFRAIVVPNGRNKVFWGIHAGHKARRPQPSPFVRVTAPVISTFTVELVGNPSRPRLVRAYPGEYIPPLPWQNSAREADGGIKACVDFWQRHSYVFNPKIMRPLPSRERIPPGWFHRY